ISSLCSRGCLGGKAFWTVRPRARWESSPESSSQTSKTPARLFSPITTLSAIARITA
ncbi:hypothetical protein MCOR24_011885, partial [Pyricularia oryzae]